NPHPAFLLTYTPDCEVVNEDMIGHYTICRGDSVQFAALPGYDHYEWSSAENLSDSASANPWCSADSSRWYTVRMWSDEGNLCPQTIPVFAEVSAIPRPRPLTVRSTSCPNPTGRITALNPKGKSPFSYWLYDVNQGGNVSNGLAPGVYDYRIRSAAGCEWDTTVALRLDPFQEASFDPFPRSGFSPLTVAFANTSTQATGYQWLINGVPISESEDITYTFPDSGSFEVSLIAYRLDETCADTATFTLRVEPGIKVLMPNIITPNGDGRNDALVAQVSGLASARWVIYNRWGNEVAAGSDDAALPQIELWQPESGVTAGQYSVVFVAEGLARQVEKMVFEVTVVE
ncbi:MAG TPA: gliding motility-associated C-terminal domain-containing protein, partial [Cryomorphaceae bacterium]|nr:gliding motility-associated C-terminal domain-containing protein [Cryomorphaceae bacterium]